MKLQDAIKRTQRRIEKSGPLHVGQSEEQTKTTLILPMLYEVLGVPQDIRHLRAEYGDAGQEKVDYAIQSDDGITLLIECKPFAAIGNPSSHLDQLRRYFGFGQCNLICLTDGCLCYFYTDMLRPGEMDDIPCYSLDLSKLTEDDYGFLAFLRLHLLEKDALHDVVRRQSLNGFIQKRIMEKAEEMLDAMGADLSVPERHREWVETLIGISCSSLDISPDTIELKEPPKPETRIVPIPAHMTLENGALYRICRTRGEAPHPYEGFLWFPDPNDIRGKCYILPGSRIRKELNPAFHVHANKVVLLRRELIAIQGNDIVLSAMPIETASGAGRIITGMDMSFAKVPQTQISAQEYYEAVPDAYNPDCRQDENSRADLAGE